MAPETREETIRSMEESEEFGPRRAKLHERPMCGHLNDKAAVSCLHCARILVYTYSGVNEDQNYQIDCLIAPGAPELLHDVRKSFMPSADCRMPTSIDWASAIKLARATVFEKSKKRSFYGIIRQKLLYHFKYSNGLEVC